jgi:hypothetical protein
MYQLPPWFGTSRKIAHVIKVGIRKSSLTGVEKPKGEQRIKAS